ncbi:hypothetical protein D3C84_760810 [compost metagenome]
MAVFGDGAERLAGNVGGAQFQRPIRCGGNLQDIAAVALRLGLQATALQQSLQALLHGEFAFKPRAVFITRQIVAAGEEYPRLFGETVECADQRAGSDRVITLLAGGLFTGAGCSGVGEGRGKTQQRDRKGQCQRTQGKTSASEGVEQKGVPWNQIERQLKCFTGLTERKTKKGTVALKCFWFTLLARR